MIGLFDVLTWLKRAPAYHEVFHFGYCGKLDNKKEKVLGVYPLRRPGSPYRAYGALESYEKVGVSLLVHYTHNAEQSQYAARKLFEFLRTPFPDADLMLIGDTALDATYPDEDEPACPVHYPGIDTQSARRIKHIDLMTNEPVFVGTDEGGIYEFVIELELYVEKEIEKHG